MKKLHRLCAAVWLAMILAILAGSTVFGAGISLKKLTLTEGYSYQLKMKGTGKAKVKWKSSNTRVATVNKKGKVSGKSAGNATISATVGKKTYKCAVKVQAMQTITVTTTKKVSTGAVTTTTKNPTVNTTPETMSSGLSAEENAVLSKLLSFKKKYPEGMYFTNAKYYAWAGGIYRGGYGCAAFCFELSDAAFGGNSSEMHYDWGDIRVGDILRVDYNTHSVIVLKSDTSGVTVAEANYNDSVHWGRRIPMSELRKTGTNIITRYDTTSYDVEEAMARGAKLPDLMDYK